MSDQPSIARIRDYWMGGTHHNTVDRELGEQITVCAPHLPYLVRAQRAWMARLVQYLVEQGVRQFLDLGSGVPVEGHVHEIAQDAAPESRVVYVDIDPAIVGEAREILVGNVGTAYVNADIRDVSTVLAAPALTNLLDLSQPVAVLFIDTLIHVNDVHDPAGIVAKYMEAMSRGSFVAVSHFSESDQLNEGLGMFSRIYGTPPTVTLREPDRIETFFAGVELVEPGVVPVPLWRPTSEHDLGRNPELAQVHAGLGLKA
ncbi:SAM-dependent methyltransferase [Saccharomonospora sp. NPDC046836]|uniref:SAM-dependent methyltransferase n=1 Tax=Saccharomonospora sp. NPDC046836 TaxID=3156921 RepID=UPI0033E4BBBB